jgi:Flp pilus assembly protein TadB
MTRERLKRVDRRQKRLLLLWLRIVSVTVLLTATFVFWSNQPLLGSVLSGIVLLHVLGLYVIERTYI